MSCSLQFLAGQHSGAVSRAAASQLQQPSPILTSDAICKEFTQSFCDHVLQVLKNVWVIVRLTSKNLPWCGGKGRI